jgi:hypothetical protein
VTSARICTDLGCAPTILRSGRWRVISLPIYALPTPCLRLRPGLLGFLPFVQCLCWSTPSLQPLLVFDESAGVASRLFITIFPSSYHSHLAPSRWPYSISRSIHLHCFVVIPASFSHSHDSARRAKRLQSATGSPRRRYRRQNSQEPTEASQAQIRAQRPRASRRRGRRWSGSRSRSRGWWWWWWWIEEKVGGRSGDGGVS